MGTGLLARELWPTSTHPHPISSAPFPGMLVWLCHLQTSRMLLPTMSAANLKQHINLYFNPNSVLVSTSDNLTRPPPPILPFYPLAAPANTLVSLHLQLMKGIMLAESSIFLLGSLCSSDVYRCESGGCCTLPFFLSQTKYICLTEAFVNWHEWTHVLTC